MKKLLILFLKFITPLLVVLLFYVWKDPFKVIWHYDSFYDSEKKISFPLNKDYVSTTTYENQYKTEHYDSFIFGNSRSIIYGIDEWKKYIPVESKAYHFDASAETIYGICKKIEYIDSKGEKLNNVLLIVDHMILNRAESLDGHLFVISPQLTSYENTANFHLQFLKTFYNYKFFPGYIEYTITGKIKPYMTKATLDEEHFLYDKRTNEMRYTIVDKEIEEGKFYTPERMKVFYKRDTVQNYAPQVIKERQKELLNTIATIFKKQGTNYKIIINPLYDQKKLNEDDIAYLIKLFGKETVYDFSGINDITNDYRNYYESSHYRPQVAKKIMKEIYTQ
ncbi:hypothetical protein [Flavobacterium sp. AG291]|uniref:hypothetical protein n=1 Tax=Flavobacterium sp. AG291 TaxID=2184000 RepID=UPI000E09F4C0|nr:hypothetical protein [Flavobacterium sp. AG291]